MDYESFSPIKNKKVTTMVILKYDLSRNHRPQLSEKGVLIGFHTDISILNKNLIFNFSWHVKNIPIFAPSK
jgi:hypothetical protein